MFAARDLAFKRVLALYETNKAKPWHEWLKNDRHKGETLDKGVQGIVGIFRSIHHPTINCVYKISKQFDNLTENEYEVLKTMKSYHFPRVIGIVKGKLNEKNELSSRGIYPVDILLMEYIEHDMSFCDLIHEGDPERTRSAFSQTLLAILEAQQKYNFTHFDLHTGNILVQFIDDHDEIFHLKEGDVVLPCKEVFIIIIDFGNSYVNTMPCLYTSLQYTTYGLYTHTFDPNADFIRLLCVYCTESEDKDMHKFLLDILPNTTEISASTGLIKPRKQYKETVTLIAHKKVRSEIKKSKFMREHIEWIEFLQVLIKLPISDIYVQDTKCFARFADIFSQLEERILDTFILMHLFKKFCCLVAQYRNVYMTESTKDLAVSIITETFNKTITDCVGYFLPKLDYDDMISTVLLMSQCIEKIYYVQLQVEHNRMDKRYKSFLFNNRPYDLYRALKGKDLCN